MSFKKGKHFLEDFYAEIVGKQLFKMQKKYGNLFKVSEVQLESVCLSCLWQSDEILMLKHLKNINMQFNIEKYKNYEKQKFVSLF